MGKIITKIGFLLLVLSVVSPSVVSAAAYNDVQFAQDLHVTINSQDYTIDDDSMLVDFVVAATTLTVKMQSGSRLIMRSSNRTLMVNDTDPAIATDCSNASISSLDIISTTTQTVIITPSGTCAAVTGGGGSSGGDTTSDTTAPVISNVSASATSDSATITWDTDESSLSWVVYGLDTDYGSEEKTTSYSTAHSVALTGLSSETTYHYQVKSKDSTGNGNNYTDQVFTTLAASTTGEETITASAGGTITATSADGGQASVELPANAVSADTVVTVTPVGTSDSTAGNPPSGSVMVGGYVYQFTATTDGTAVSEFDTDLTLTFTYTDEQVASMDESSLVVYYWDTDTSAWVALESTVDVSTNTITATTSHFTDFAVMGDESEGDGLDELRAQIAELQALIATATARLAVLLGTSPITGVPSTFSFDTNLQLGDVGDSVKYLQIVLNSNTATKLAETGVGSPGHETTYFGPLTKAGMAKFQETYQSVCLTPWGLTKGTGFVGTTTREKLNSLLGK